MRVFVIRLIPLCLFVCGAASAATPVLTELKPRGAQRGKTFTLVLTGREILEGSKLVTTLPAVLTPLTPTMKGTPWLVELKADAPVGTYPVRVQNPSGLSNILLFTVGSFPEVAELETAEPSNDSIAAAEPVKSLPVTINGNLRGADRDFYRIAAKAGERRVFEVEARRCGSAIDPVLELFSEKGELLARNEDAPGIGVDSRIDYTFPRDGAYYVEVHDARFSKQDQNFYRLKIGDYSYPEAIFPLGGKHGATLNVEFTGKSGITKSTVRLPDIGRFAAVSMPGSPTLPLTLALSDADAFDGRIVKPGQVDKYPVKVKPGESLLIELQARELGTSRLDGLITVYDAHGKKLGAAGDTAPPVEATTATLVGRIMGDAFLNVKAPDDATELTVAVEDLAQRAGPDFGYRLSVKHTAEDFLVTATPAFVNVPRGGTTQIVVNVDRRGYDGPIHASIPGLPKGWTAEGGFIAPETVDASGQRFSSRRATLTVTASPDAEMPQSDLVVTAEARLADGSTIKRQAPGAALSVDIANGTGLPDPGSTDRQKPFTAPWLNLAMPASLAREPSATLLVKQINRTAMAEGDAFDFEWSIESKDKTLAMPATIGVDAPGARDLRIIDMKAESKGAPKGTFRITTTKNTAPATYDVVANANLMVDGVRETIFSRALPWAVTDGGTNADTSNKSAAGGN